MQIAYLLIGVPGVGKTWLMRKLEEMGYACIHHDDYMQNPSFTDYFDAIESEIQKDKPVVCETPFSISRITLNLEERGIAVVPVFLIADAQLLHQRWDERQNVADKNRRGHLSRQNTFKERACEMDAPIGTSCEILEHFKKAPHRPL